MGLPSSERQDRVQSYLGAWMNSLPLSKTARSFARPGCRKGVCMHVCMCICATHGLPHSLTPLSQAVEGLCSGSFCHCCCCFESGSGLLHVAFLSLSSPFTPPSFGTKLHIFLCPQEIERIFPSPLSLDSQSLGKALNGKSGPSSLLKYKTTTDLPHISPGGEGAAAGLGCRGR
jgi:hypothetical protein